MHYAEIVFPAAAQLGEGASWSVVDGSLWWVDILGKTLFRGDPITRIVESWPQDTEIGASVPATDGRRALVMRDHVDLFDPATNARTPFWRGDEPSTNRFNDAGTDRRGNLWIASMDYDAAAPTGALWRVTAAGEGRKVLSGFACLNGPVFSLDGRTLYLGDTMTGRVLAFDHDPATGDLERERTFIKLGALGGLSDGMAVDDQGCLWLCRVTAGRVTRYSPDGRPLTTIALPVPMTTSCAFGGTDLSTLFVTTARIILDPADLAAYPESGAVFAARVAAKGCPVVPFGDAGIG